MAAPVVRFRIDFAEHSSLGPGKIRLLEAIRTIYRALILRTYMPGTALRILTGGAGEPRNCSRTLFVCADC
jgi:hypothetical protein